MTNILDLEQNGDNMDNVITNTSIVRKVTLSKELDQKILMLAAKYHSDLIFKKKEDLYNNVVKDAINYMYEHKFLKELGT